MATTEYSSAVLDLIGTGSVQRHFVGGFNKCVVATDGASENSTLRVIRSPLGAEARAETEQSIRKEYTAIGATALGVDFSVRTPREQAQFVQEAKAAGLQVVDYVKFGRHLVAPFIEGTPLDNYVKMGNESVKPQVLENVLSHLGYAHSLGLVFGDRWTPNTIITPDDNFVELDFDIALKGPAWTTATFEFSQMLYHLEHFAVSDGNKDNVVHGTLEQLFTDRPHILANYPPNHLGTFLIGQLRYFSAEASESTSPYYGAVPEKAVLSLVRTIKAAHEHLPSGPATNSMPPVMVGPGISQEVLF